MKKVYFCCQIMNEVKQKYKYKEGQEVCHIDNISQKMYIERLVKSSRMIEHDNEQKQINFINGIRCHWWEDKQFKTAIFHTKELVPLEIAEEGYAAVMRWKSENI